MWILLWLLIAYLFVGILVAIIVSQLPYDIGWFWVIFLWPLFVINWIFG